MHNFLTLLKESIANFFFQLAIRMYEIFPKEHNPSGLGYLGFSIAINIISASFFFISRGIIDKKFENNLVSLSLLLGFIVAILAIYLLNVKNDCNALLKEELKKGKKYNLKWRLITWIYLLITIVFALA